jgi:membrane protein DedA with SNARE-associated domain
LWTAVGGFFYSYVPGVTPENVDYVGRLYQDNAVAALFGAAFTPIPFKVFTIGAGVFHTYVPLTTLIVVSLAGRSLRFFLVAICIYFFGPRVKAFMERYFEIATLVLFLLVVAGFVAIKYWM